MKKSYYAIIPANVRYDEDLTANAKLLYGEITALCNEKGYCWANNNYFAKLYGVSTRSITNWISQLSEKGYISTELIYKEKSKEVKERRIYIGRGIEENFYRYRKEVPEGIEENFCHPIEENFQDNNTLFNNTTNTTVNNSDDDIFRKIVQAFEQNGFGTINMTTKEMLVELVETYTGEWVLDAIEVAVKSNVRRLNYVEGILKRWKVEGKGMERKKEEVDPYAGMEVY